MRFHSSIFIVGELLGLVAIAQGMPAQELLPPDHSPPLAQAHGERVARLLDGMANHRPYVRFDSSTGVVRWIVPRTVPPASREPTAEGVAARFIGDYADLLGVHPTKGSLILSRVRADGIFTHFHYAQHHAGHRVLNGELLVHVIRTPGGFAVQGANGHVFPGVDVSMSSIGYASAQDASLAGVERGIVAGKADTAAVIVAHAGSYRLTYRTMISDPGRGAIVTRYVDARNGIVYGESPASPSSGSSTVDDLSGLGRKASSPSGLSGTRRRSSGFETLVADDWYFDERSFGVLNTGSVYQLRDPTQPGVAEIQVYDLNEESIDNGRCDNEALVEHPNNAAWPDDEYGREEVSAVHNLGETVAYFRNKGFTNGMHDDSTDILRGCVHGTEGAADYDPENHRLSFRAKPNVSGWGPVVAARDVVTHEFAHGIHWYWVGYSQPTATDEGLADYWGARTNDNDRCVLGSVRNGDCIRYLHKDSTSNPICPGGPTEIHCAGIRLAAALLGATEVSQGSFADETDNNVMQGTVGYVTPSMTPDEAAFAILARARTQEHYGGQFGASAELHTQFYTHGLQPWGPMTVQMYSDWSVTTNNGNYLCGYVAFEIGTSGLFPNDSGVAWPDSEIDLGYHCTFEAPISFGGDELNWHWCGDGHAHGFRITVDLGYGPLSYYNGRNGCGGGSLVAGPGITTGALPTRFAVRQAIETPTNVLAVTSGAPRSLSAQIRQYGLTALDVDIPTGVAAAPVEVRIYNPQGRLVRRLMSDRVGPGTQRVPWDRKDEGGRDAPPGVYVVLVQHGSFKHRTHFVIPAGP